MVSVPGYGGWLGKSANLSCVYKCCTELMRKFVAERASRKDVAYVCLTGRKEAKLISPW